jgi:hypothetical protein
MPMTNYLANSIANAVLRNTTYTSPANVYASLYSVAPTANTAGTELTGNGYARQLTTFDVPAAGATVSNVAVSFGAASGNNWPTVVAFGIVDASTSGNILFYQPISARNIKIGDTLDIDSGAITIDIG